MMNRSAILEADEESSQPGGETWSRQVFRALLTPEELAAYERALQGELPPDAPPASFGGSSWQGIEPDVWLPGRSALQLYAFTLALKAVYWGAQVLAPLLRKAPRARAEGTPLRVLRMVSVISQGGVAKVCQQTLLRMPREAVENQMLIFGEKKGTTPELETHRPDIELLQRKMVLWPGSFRWKMIRNIFKLAKMIRRQRPDLIHLHEPQFAPAVRAAALLAGGVPLCVHLHNDYNERRRSIRDGVLDMTRHALRESHLIACSRTILEAGKLWLGKTRHPWELIEDGSDDLVATHIEDGLPEALKRAAAGRKIVAMMAHIVPHKRIEDFMAGCRILQDEGQPIFVLLMAYGRKRAGRLLRKRFNRVFAPHEGEYLYAVQSPPRVLDQVAVGVSTSVLEGLGLNVLEYQVEGVPVVCTDLMPHREMVTHEESGLLFPGYNLPEFLRQMRRLLNDDALARKIGDGGRQAAAQRTWAGTASNMVRFYHDVLRRESR